MAQQPNLFPLKLLVISLGVVLIGGTICLFGAIAGKAGKELSASKQTAAALPCPDARIALESSGKITGIAPFGDNVQITLTLPTETKLLTVDRCSGKILQTLTIAP